jgi:hypothetical protein
LALAVVKEYPIGRVSTKVLQLGDQLAAGIV